MLRRVRSGQSLSTRPISRTSSTSAYAAARASSSVSPSVAGARRERLPLNPAANGIGQLGDEQRLVVVGGMRVGESRQRAENGCARPACGRRGLDRRIAAIARDG